MILDKLLFDRYFEDFSKYNASDLVSLLNVKSKTIIPELNEKLFEKKLNIKHGIDPTGANLHLGHLCSIFILNLFVKFGHNVSLVIGDFTAKIGDPSGRNTEREVITDEKIAENFKTWSFQIAPYINLNRISLRQNSEWLEKTTSSQLFRLFSQMNLATMLQREDFRKRLETGGITFAEVAYASLMGLDSVALKTDIEIGGVDQLLNLMQCREVQKIYGMKPETAYTVPILEGTDGSGRKMSKSFKNYIAVNSDADDMFGKFMSIPDNLILQYCKSFGYLFESELKELKKFIAENPMEAKKQLATYFVSIKSKDLSVGKAARERFEAKFSKKKLTENDYFVVKVEKGTPIIDALYASGKYDSKGAIKRLILGNGVKNLTEYGEELIRAELIITKPLKLKAGKLNFFKIEIK
jgi:tyrosyl-tRNA synthetase